MRKIAKSLIVCIVALTACFSLFACDKQDSPSPTPPSATEPEEHEPEFFEKKEGYVYGDDVEITYTSKVTGTERKAYVTLPPNYDESKRYPVLYLLHGMACNHTTWLELCSAKYVVQNLFVDEGVAQMIVVSVDSNVTAGEIPDAFSTDYCAMFDKTGEEIVTSLMPYVNKRFSTLQGRENTAIAGFSMGGREALLTAFANQDCFNYVGAFSPSGFGNNVVSFDTTVPDFQYDEGKRFDLVMLAIGKYDMSTGLFFPKIDEKLTQNGITHLTKQYLGTHDPSVWRQALYDFAKLIFQTNKTAAPKR